MKLQRLRPAELRGLVGDQEVESGEIRSAGRRNRARVEARLASWCAGPGEEGMAREVVAASEGAARLAPRTSLRELVPYIRRARLFVSGDSGPLHLASACGVPAVGIFGPTDPARNGPFGEGDEVVWKEVACSPCYKQRCPGYGNVCLTAIEVDDVLGAVRKRLGGEMIDYERFRGRRPLVRRAFRPSRGVRFPRAGARSSRCSPDFRLSKRAGASPRASSRSAPASRVFSKSFAGPSSGRRWRRSSESTSRENRRWSPCGVTRGPRTAASTPTPRRRS